MTKTHFTLGQGKSTGEIKIIIIVIYFQVSNINVSILSIKCQFVLSLVWRRRIPLLVWRRYLLASSKQNEGRDNGVPRKDKPSDTITFDLQFDNCSVNCCYNDYYGRRCTYSFAFCARLFDCLLALNSLPRRAPCLCLVTQSTRFSPLFEFPNKPRSRRWSSVRCRLSKIRRSLQTPPWLQTLALALPPGIRRFSVGLWIWRFEINIKLWPVNIVIPFDRDDGRSKVFQAPAIKAQRA